MTPTLWTIGYEQLWPDALVAELEAAGIQRVLDVRLRPQSRRPGMSKTKLALEARRARDRATSTGGSSGRRWRSAGCSGRGIWRRRPRRVPGACRGTAGEELDALAAELDRGPRTALLCLEANPAGCHRRVVAELLAARRPGLVVVDL